MNENASSNSFEPAINLGVVSLLVIAFIRSGHDAFLLAKRLFERDYFFTIFEHMFNTY